MPQAYYQDLSITIELEDMNDNAPVFVSDIINIEINENTRSAYSLDNQMAYDPDIGKISKNSIFYQNVKNTQKESKILKTPVKWSFIRLIQNCTFYILYHRKCLNK